jgi:hypothetical protein
MVNSTKTGGSMTMRARIQTGLAATACAIAAAVTVAPAASAAPAACDGQVTINGGACYGYAWYQDLRPGEHDKVRTASNGLWAAMCFGEWSGGQAIQLDAFFAGSGERAVKNGHRADFIADCGYF